MVTIFLRAIRSMGWALRPAAIALLAVMLLPGMSGLPARAATVDETQARTVSAAVPADGALIHDTSTGKVYLIWAGRRHWIDSPATLNELAYPSSSITSLPSSQVTVLPDGTVLSLHTVAGGLVWPWAAIRATPVQLNLSQPSATAGTSLRMSATGFQPNEPVVVSAPGGISFTAFADGQGTLTVNVPVQSGMNIGIHHIYAQGSLSHLFGVQVFRVIALAPAPLISMVSTTVARGTSLGVSGSGFGPNEPVRIFLNYGTSAIVVTANAGGAFGPVSVPVPASLAAGTYGVHAYGVTSARATGAQVAVVEAAAPTATMTAVPQAAAVVVVSPASTSPGLLVVISGSGFAPGETVLLRFNGALANSASAGATGNFAGVLFSVPPGTASGMYQVTATGATSQRSAGTSLSVQPPQPAPPAGIAISPINPQPGAKVLVAGTGFQPGENVVIRFNNVLVQHLAAGTSGSFTNGSFVVPNTLGPGRYTVQLLGATSGRTASATLTVVAPPTVITTRLSVNPSTIAPGAQFTLSGSGFIPGEQVIVRMDSATAFGFFADGSGSFSAARSIKTAPIGNHTLTATGSTSHRVASTTLHVVKPVAASMSLAPTTAHRGTVVKVSGKSFVAGEVVLIRFGNTLMQATLADRNGRFANAGFTVPSNAAYGVTYVSSTGSRSGRSSRAALHITPSKPVSAHIKLSSTSLHRGSKVSFSATGYQAGEVVLIRYRGALIQAVAADSHGNVGKAGFQIPANSPYGTYPVSATGAKSGKVATVSVHVTATLSIGISVSPAKAPRNSVLTVSGHGFTAGEVVLLRLNGQLMQGAKADSHGNFGRTSFRIPATFAKGKVIVLATGAKSGRHTQATISIV